MPNIINWVVSAWKGEARLVHVFWFGMLAIMGIELAIAFTFGVSSDGPSIPHFILSSAMSVWWWVSVWKCAPNASAEVWLWLARGLIIFQILSWLAMLAVLLGTPVEPVTYEGYETIR